MAYVRQRGNQLAIVRGVRDAATGKVEQQILMTLYSRDEAREAIGPGAHRFQDLLRESSPGMRFDWKAISKAIESKLHVLPESYGNRAERLLGGFRDALCAFTRQLGFAEPQRLSSAAALIQENEHELAFLRDLVDWRLKLRRTAPNEYSRDPYLWRLSLERKGIPMDVEELAEGILERGEQDKAEAAFRLLADAFGEDADTSNQLGLIALERRELDEALRRFEAAARIARRSFPRKIARRNMGRDLETRPYVRALRNLALAQIETGRFEDALATCTRLEKECGDALTANAHRAVVYLSTGRFELALEAARFCENIHPTEGFVAALAAIELGRHEEALAAFLHAALSNRAAARILVGERASESEDHYEAEDHQGGVYMLRRLEHYFASASGKRARRALRDLKRMPAVAELLSEMEAVVRRWRGDNKTDGWRAAFDRMTRMHKRTFADGEARRILGGE